MSEKAFAVLASLLIFSGAIVAAVVHYETAQNDDTDVLDEFLEICKIPRYSKHEIKMEEYLVDIAKKYDYPYERDSVGNLLIDHPGPIKTSAILQAHMDMVAVQDEGVTHDWDNDPIQTVIEGGYVSAVGTSLGADDGAGLAIIVCALKSDSMKPYSFRCIFTVDEEEDLTGVNNIKKEWLAGFDNFINIDNNIDNQICMGSAGMYVENVDASVGLNTTECDSYSLELRGFKGGHSGDKIDVSVNVIMLAFEFLKQLKENTEVRLISFESGTAENVIPNKASVSFAVETGIGISDLFDSWKTEVEEKYGSAEPSMEIILSEKTHGSATAWNANSSSELIDAVNECPPGVIRRSDEGIMLSLNYGVLKIGGGNLVIEMSSRGADENENHGFADSVVECFTKHGFHATEEKLISSWLESKDCVLLRKATDIFKNRFGKDPEIAVIHAGTECGEFKNINPDMEIISVGATMFNEHSTSERLSIDSLKIEKEYVFDLIKKIGFRMP